ncbi:putative GTP-binding protein 6 isoform X2 [Patiria miniata]|nr:putative GTP-binding protein 6 isoform X2 [Patiria miniata]XP_038053431.1 putative GTP-binding protein 6 isoform X2 [Patiria miniata]XP_038053432.1 putative GTP-binding protein 6 isoform X2 [Patiria miniata]XP_038053433.1 putative GTP-binding protein 6 isoform X2 [Patiria miniata]XP_038053434.1 putative GTP-binding protein 6 isoform X2 [Patiria miniata]
MTMSAITKIVTRTVNVTVRDTLTLCTSITRGQGFPCIPLYACHGRLLGHLSPSLNRTVGAFQCHAHCKISWSVTGTAVHLPWVRAALAWFPKSSYQTTHGVYRKHKKTKEHRTTESLGSDIRTIEDDMDDDTSEWDAILLQEEHISEDLDPPPVGGHRFLVLQPDLKIKGSKHGQVSNPQLQLEESMALIETIPDWTVVEGLVQGVKEPAKKSVFGKGTHAKLTEMIQSSPEITAVFVSVEKLSALQQKELEEAWGVQVYDRYGVVLKIFKDHARTREAKMQIALAEIPYLRSRLRNESSSMDQQRGGHSFISGGGETYLTVRQRVLKEREQKVRKALDQLKKKQTLLRSGRTKKNFPVVSVVGYTNAGKTTLIKALSGDATMQPKDQLFATLDVTAHAATLPNRMPVIYMDTVGFISALPHNLVASFAATLEDVLLSDVIVHVRDISHPDTVSQKLNVLQVLTELGVSDSLIDNMVEVCNKADKLQEPMGSEHEACGILVSADKGDGLDKLKDCIQDKLLEVTDIIPCQLEIPMSGPHLSWLYKEATVTSTEAVETDHDAHTMIVNAIMNAATFAKFRGKFGDLRKPAKSNLSSF